ncbi:MAG: DUF1801 domain-containing protein [Candidatus Synoicihabitans palmerolidicus]|nr:DUF1801 domain-containing protein [Candidatus Synoicihabitans palmerolidicus]
MKVASDPRIDRYIDEAQPFAQSILRHLRQQIHRALPGVVKTLKWGVPAYTLKGKLVCFTAAFTTHSALSFWPKSIATYLAHRK